MPRLSARVAILVPAAHCGHAAATQYRTYAGGFLQVYQQLVEAARDEDAYDGAAISTPECLRSQHSEATIRNAVGALRRLRGRIDRAHADSFADRIH